MTKLGGLYSGRLEKRIRYLIEITKEETDQVPLSVLSLRALVDFLSKKPDVGYPDIVLTAEGNIRAVWNKNDKNQYLALEFLGGSDIRRIEFHGK